MIPTVEFRVAEVKDIIDVIYHFLENKSIFNSRENILKRYPSLRERLVNTPFEKEKEGIRNFFDKYHEKNRHILESIKTEFQKQWDIINDKLMLALQEVTETPWKNKHKKFIARVSVNPVCPRYLNENTFDIYFGLPNQLMKAIVIHELSHFIFFEKWKEVFPNTNEEEFESPHILWILSEIVPYAVLSDERIQKVFRHEPVVYDVLKTFKIKGKPLLETLKQIYECRRNFKDFIRKAWSYIQENKKEFNVIF